MADDTTPAAGDDYLSQLLAANPDLAAQLGGGGAISTGPLMGNDLAAALMGSAMDITGRYGQTGSPYVGSLPTWAQGLASQVTTSPDFDPYLGVVSQTGDERVYFGGKQQQVTEVTHTGNKFSTDFGAPAPETGTVTHTEKSDKTLTVTQAMNMPYTWSEQEVADAIKRLKAAGMNIDSFDGSSSSLVTAWSSLVQRAAAMYDLSGGDRKVTPWDVLDLYKNERSALGLPDPNGTKTTVQRNVTDITEGEAWSNLQSTLSQMLGRDPSDQETRDFTYRMNHMAAQNPSISKTVTQYKNGEAVSSSTHTNPGFTSADAAKAAYDAAQNDPDYAEYRGASYLFNAALSALGPIGG